MTNYLFQELDTALTAELAGSQIPSANNRFIRKVNAIIIEDTFNNLAFPMPKPIIDTKKYDLPSIIEQYTMMYSQDNFSTSLQILPWHFTVELVGRHYVIYNTRPLNMLYPLDIHQLKEVSKDKIILNSHTEEFLNSARDIRTTVRILVIGNSQSDVYAKQLYMKLGQFIIAPIARMNQFVPNLYTNLIPLNMGRRFLANVLTNYVR